MDELICPKCGQPVAGDHGDVRIYVHPDFHSPSLWDDGMMARPDVARLLSAELREELWRWQLQWDEWVTDKQLSATPDGWRRWESWGQILVVRVQAELGNGFVVEGDFEDVHE